MAGHSNNLCYILLFCASLVSAGDKISPSDQTTTVPVTQGNINSNAVALCKYYVSSHYNSLAPTSVSFLVIHAFSIVSPLVERLFQLKRSEQKDAVQRIAEVKSIEKQRKLLELVITKIMEVVGLTFQKT
jgi:hypothetical protein